MKVVAVLFALLVGIQCAAGYTGFIRTSSEKFVDDNCQEFVPLGMNTYGFLHQTPYCEVIYRICKLASHPYHPSVECCSAMSTASV